MFAAILEGIHQMDLKETVKTVIGIEGLKWLMKAASGKSSELMEKSNNGRSDSSIIQVIYFFRTRFICDDIVEKLVFS